VRPAISNPMLTNYIVANPIDEVISAKSSNEVLDHDCFQSLNAFINLFKIYPKGRISCFLLPCLKISFF
jgi:hypothetical protein